MLEDESGQLKAGDRVLDDWTVPLQKAVNDEDEGEESRINKNRQIERILIVSMIKNRNNKFVINEAFLNNAVSSSSEIHHTESQMPTVHRSDSVTLGSTDNLPGSASYHPSKTHSGAGNELKMERQASSEIFVKKSLVSRQEVIIWNEPTEQTKYLTSNIAYISSKLENQMIKPMDKYLKNLEAINKAIDEVESVDLFSHISEALMTPNGRGLKDINLNILKESLKHIENYIDLSQVHF